MGYGRETDGCGSCVKIMVFIMNIACLLGGAAVLAVGCWIVADQMYMAPIMGDGLYKGAAGLIIAVGCLTVILAFLGCFGAVTENKGMLGLYSGLIMFVFILLLIGAILAFVFRKDNRLGDNFMKSMNDSMLHYDNDTDIREAWDLTQQELKCCGTTMYLDWQLYAHMDTPDSCYEGDTFYWRGCWKTVEDTVQDNSAIIAGMGLGISALLFCGSILSCCLSRMIE